MLQFIPQTPSRFLVYLLLQLASCFVQPVSKRVNAKFIRIMFTMSFVANLTKLV